MYLTICALSSLHRTQNKDGKKMRELDVTDERENWGGGVKDGLIAYA